MTVEEIAQKLDGTEYPVRVPSEVSKLAKANGIVIVYGASDDLMEFEGAIHDEVGVYDGGKAFVSPDGLIADFESIDKDDKDALRKYFASESSGVEIEAVWNEDGYSFTYKTEISHVTFEVVEEGDKYCRGIVFKLADCISRSPREERNK